METTTSEYGDYDYNDTSTPIPVCLRERDNIVGAHLSILFYFMFLFSVCFNVLVLVIIHRFEKLTTVTNIFLLNLVVSSLIFVSSLPFLAVYMQRSEWIFGSAMCKIVSTVYYMGIYSSVLFLALLTFDRHLAVVYSLGASRMRNRKYAIASCVVVWLVTSLACVKQMIIHKSFNYSIDNKTYCEEHTTENDLKKLRLFGFYLQIFLFFLFPLAVIIYCYIRIAITVLTSKIVTKFKTVRLIFVIVVLFFVCWTPYNIVQLMHDSGAHKCKDLENLGYALHITRNLAYIYFCISPIFYTFVGRKFQNYFRLMLVNRFPRLRKHISVSQHTGTNMSTKTTPNDL
ncbi:C-C chemokine receptor type 1-like [Larimichthys crocea]|uniref:C-C chemokine receptor type 1-like n=1 Tax=Larimichthys crocea TaxID=215358 RepID=UPI000F5F5676|nr:C-C chemokine receptor type 1-like [Larimichthys crocea]